MQYFILKRKKNKYFSCISMDCNIAVDKTHNKNYLKNLISGKYCVASLRKIQSESF